MGIPFVSLRVCPSMERHSLVLIFSYISPLSQTPCPNRTRTDDAPDQKSYSLQLRASGNREQLWILVFGPTGDTSSIWRSLDSPSDCCWIGSRQGNAKTRRGLWNLCCVALSYALALPFPHYSVSTWLGGCEKPCRTRRTLSIVIAYFRHLAESKCREKLSLSPMNDSIQHQKPDSNSWWLSCLLS